MLLACLLQEPCDVNRRVVDSRDSREGRVF